MSELTPKERILFGYISPISYLHKIPEDEPFHLILAHLLKHKKYVNFYNKRREMGDYILLDNSAFEFQFPIQADIMLKMIDESGINANCLVAPDYPFEPGIKTIKSTENFIKQLRDKGMDYDVMGVPQSVKGDWKGWIDCYKELSQMDGCSHIGLSILGCPNAFCSITKTEDIMINRLFAVITLLDRGLVADHIWHHALGLGMPREILLQRELGVVDSNDSSSPIWHGIQGIEYDDSYGCLKNGKCSIPVDFEIERNDNVKKNDVIIDKNIETIKYFTR